MLWGSWVVSLLAWPALQGSTCVSPIQAQPCVPRPRPTLAVARESTSPTLSWAPRSSSAMTRHPAGEERPAWTRPSNLWRAGVGHDMHARVSVLSGSGRPGDPGLLL
jgi:hypothetical protein